MTEEERRKYEQWKKSFGSNEALSQAVYRYNADPYWYGGPQEARYIKKGASEEAIEDYYWSVREDEKRREKARKEMEEMDRLWAERKAREEAALARLEYTAHRFEPICEPELTAEQVATNRRAGEVFYRDLLARSGRG